MYHFELTANFEINLITMKDEAQQALNNIDWLYKQFTINMKITTGEVMEIYVLNNETFEQYTQIIDQTFITEHDGLRLFDEPFDLFDYLYHHSEDIVVSDEKFEFQYVTGNLKKKVKTITFNLVKQEAEPLLLAFLKC
jgi:hypothetical protein